MIVGCYSLDLYCDNEKAHENEYPTLSFESTGRSRAQCLQAAKRAGWAVDIRKRTARCPKCKGIRIVNKESKQ